MSISVKSLEELVLSNARTSDSVTIISGYFSADIIDHIASTGIPVTFYYGMYLWNGMTDLQYRSLNNLLASHKNPSRSTNPSLSSSSLIKAVMQVRSCVPSS